MKSTHRVPRLWISTGTIATIFAVWLLVTNSGLVEPTYLPSPEALLHTFSRLARNGYMGVPLWRHIEISLFRALSGFCLGVAIGVPTGLLTGYVSAADAVVSPIMAFLRPIPPIAFIPMVVLYFGLGETGKVVLITVTAFNYMHVNAHSGAMHVNVAYLRAAKTLGLSRGQMFRKIVFPAALPSIFTGLKVAMALSWAVVVAAELVGAQQGLGFMISNAAQMFQIPVVFIGIALIGLIGLALNVMLGAAEAHIVHWKGR